jgi:branched-chain amino acid transport system permease protein
VSAALGGRMTSLGWLGVAALVVVLLLVPLIFSDFFYGVLLTKALWLGLVAMSLIFLSSYGGMVSLAQVGVFGVAGFTMANLVAADGGLATAIDPWLAVMIGLAAAVVVGLILGAISARSEGIYFLMITLAFGVMVFYFFGQVTQLSGHGGVNNVEVPGLIGDRVTQPAPLYYISVGVAAAAFLAVRYLGGTPFGLSLQGIRDDPVRMRALGYHVTLHRTVAFGFAALIAAAAGILSVWYNRRIDPGSVGLGQVINVLVIAVIGGLYRLQGAWVGALAFVLLDNYTRRWTPDIGTVLGPDRFNTLLGIIFLVIVLVSPGGLVGAWEQARDRIRATLRGRPARAGPEDATDASASQDSIGQATRTSADRPGLP